MKSKDQAILVIFMLKKQKIWLVERILKLKVKNQTVELLEITESIPSFYQWLFTCQNHHHSSIQPWHIARWILEIAFGMTRYAWPHPYEWTESHWCFYVGLTHLLGTTEQTPTSMDPLSHAKNNFKAQLILVMKLTQHSA